MRIVGNLRVPTGHSRVILLQAKWSLGSSQVRSDGSCDDQAGEAGPVEHSSAEAKSLKTRGQGTVRLLPQWATTEPARWGGQRPNKGLLSRQFTKEQRA